MKQQEIFVVIEEENGFVHSAHTNCEDAQKEAEKLMYETNYENFAVQQVTLFIN
jgi:hypothetical protein